MTVLIERLKAARRVSAPLIAIETADAAATIRTVVEGLNGGTAAVVWDVANGMLAINDAGQNAMQRVDTAQTEMSEFGCVRQAEALEAGCILFAHWDRKFWESPPTVQQVWNLRDKFKADQRTLVLLDRAFTIPDKLQGEIVILEDPLPNAEQISGIVDRVVETHNKNAAEARGSSKKKIPDAELDERTRQKCIDMARGMHDGQAELLLQMCLGKDGKMDLTALAERQRKIIEQVQGLTVFRNAGTFADIGGLEPLKEYVAMIMKGRNAPKLVVWLDEIGTTGLGSRQDLSGVNNMMEGTLLQFLQDNRAYGILLAGVPGCLHGATQVFDPVNKTTKSVSERHQEGRPFYVWSMRDDGTPVIAVAMPPRRYERSVMLRFTWESGEQTTVTPGHRFLAGVNQYVYAGELACDRGLFSVERLRELIGPRATNWELVQQVLRQGVPHWTRRPQGFRVDCQECSCFCGEQLRSAEGSDRSLAQRSVGAGRPCCGESCKGGLDGTRTGSLSLRSCQFSMLDYLSRPAAAFSAEFLPLGGPQQLAKGSIQVQPQLPGDSFQTDKVGLLPCVEMESRRFGRLSANWEIASSLGQRTLGSESTFGRFLVSSCLAGKARGTGRVHLTGCDAQALCAPDENGDAIGNASLHYSGLVGVCNIEVVEDDDYYDFHVPVHNNYWAGGMFHHNCGKSEFCKSVGGEFDRVVVRLDLDATKGSLVGASEEQLRSALRVIKACADDAGSMLWIATANSIESLSSALRNRFVDTFMFDLPTRKERQPIWKVWLDKMGLSDEPYQDDEGWNGRNVWQAVDKSWRTGLPIADVAKWITPVGITDAEGIESLRKQADGRYLSASQPGLYRRPRQQNAGRRVEM